jgi:predicted AlkP superfamily phosphohydrolase/phosphomutase
LEVNGVAPDLITYFGDLRWRSVGTVGLGGIHTFENDTGSDEANHNWDGIFILDQKGCDIGNIEPGAKEGLDIYDIAPTIINLFGLNPIENIRGKGLTDRKESGILCKLKKIWS